MDKIEHMVEVKLTPDEFQRKAQRLAAVRKERRNNDEQRKAWAATFKDKDGKLSVEEEELIEVVETGAEKRSITCLPKPDYTRAVVEYVREDMIAEDGTWTKDAIAETRPMSSHEKQMRLPKTEKTEQPKADEPEPETATDGPIDTAQADATETPTEPAPKEPLPAMNITIELPKADKPGVQIALPTSVSDMLMEGEEVTIVAEGEDWPIKLEQIEIAGVALGHRVEKRIRVASEDKHGPYNRLLDIVVFGVRREQEPPAAEEPKGEEPTP